jgi:hypothetical protein
MGLPPAFASRPSEDDSPFDLGSVATVQREAHEVNVSAKKELEPEDMGLPLTFASRLSEDNLPFDSDSAISVLRDGSEVNGAHN